MAKVRYNQSLVDLAIQETGSVEGLVGLAVANGFSVTELLKKNTNIDTVPATNTDVVTYLKSKAIQVATGAQMFADIIISVSPTTLNFGTVQVGSNAQLNFTITNTGEANLVVTSITLPFATYTTSWSSGTIPASSSQVVTVTYTPTTSGAQNGNITVNSNATSVTSNTVAVTSLAIDLTLSKSTAQYFTDSNNDTVTITTNTAWTASSNVAWLTLSQASGTGNATITYTWNLPAGTYISPLPAIITITGGGITRTLTLQNYSSGGELTFDGVNDVINGTNASQLNFGTGDFSISGIIKIANPNTLQCIFIKCNELIAPSFVGYVVYLLGNRKIQFAASSGGTVAVIETTNALAANATHHFTIVKSTQSTSGWKIYINGVESQTVVTSHTLAGSVSTTGSWRIGREISSFYFLNETMIDLMAFNKALSASENTDLLNSKNNLIPATASANLVARWNFNQNQGTTLIDSSGNALNGTLTGFANTALGASNAWRDIYGNALTS